MPQPAKKETERIIASVSFSLFGRSAGNRTQTKRSQSARATVTPRPAVLSSSLKPKAKTVL